MNVFIYLAIYVCTLISQLPLPPYFIPQKTSLIFSEVVVLVVCSKATKPVFFIILRLLVFFLRSSFFPSVH